MLIFQGRVHLFVGIAGGRISDDGHLIAQLRAEANRRLEQVVRDEAHHDQLLNALPLEQKVQVGIGKTAGAPMLWATTSPGRGSNSMRS